jgi:hypothetical protein
LGHIGRVNEIIRHIEWLVVIALLIVITVTLRCPVAPTEAMANTVVKLVPSKEVVEPGESFTVDVVIEPTAGANVAGAQFDLSYNNQSVTVDSVQEGPFLKSGGANSFFVGGYR